MIVLWLYVQMKRIHTHRFGIFEVILACHIVSKGYDFRSTIVW